MKKVLLITRPITPPWDEASKNFAYTLAKKITHFKIGLLTRGHIPALPENVYQHPIYTANSFNYLQKLKLVKNLRKIRKNYNILHYIFTPTKLNSFLIKNFLNNPQKTKSIQTIATLREDLYSDKEIKKLIFGDLVITYSHYAKNKLNSLGFKNIKQIYPGIDVEKYKNKPKDQKLMQEKNILPSDFVINFTGEYTRLGAIDLVINSFIKIATIIPEAKLSLAVRLKNEKDIQKKREVVQKLKKHQLLERVSFFDDGVYEMPLIYNLCDISLFPVNNMKGKFDVPLAVIEAMACKKTVIISDLPILEEFAKNDNSVIIERDNLQALQKAILDLYENKDKRQKIGGNARNFVINNFDIQKIAPTYQQIYKKL